MAVMCRLFALGRMVEVLLVNLHRLHDLWPVFLAHVVELLGDTRPVIRAACLDALTRAVGGALASVVPSSGARSAAQGTPFLAQPTDSSNHFRTAHETLRQVCQFVCMPNLKAADRQGPRKRMLEQQRLGGRSGRILEVLA